MDSKSSASNVLRMATAATLTIVQPGHGIVPLVLKYGELSEVLILKNKAIQLLYIYLQCTLQGRWQHG